MIAAPLPIVAGSGSPGPRARPRREVSTVAHAVGTALARLGVTTVFGVVGSGNFHVTNALTAAGARFVAARHEGGAAVMADAYARVSGGLGVLSRPPGPWPDQRDDRDHRGGQEPHPDAGSRRRGHRAPVQLPHRPARPRESRRRGPGADHVAGLGRRRPGPRLPHRHERAPDRRCSTCRSTCRPPRRRPRSTCPSAPPRRRRSQHAVAIEALADALTAARRPVFIAGRGARHAKQELNLLSERAGRFSPPQPSPAGCSAATRSIST